MPDIPLQIRKVIFEKYNDPDVRFTNDEIFSILQKDGIIDNSITIDDMEQHFTALCDAGVMRNIAQNFTTQWFKLFEPLEKINCPACNVEVYLGKSEDRICPNAACRAAI
ncbi:MAG: hypothetical protein QW177_03470 [Candidatus Nitrosotenuis sp.]